MQAPEVLLAIYEDNRRLLDKMVEHSAEIDEWEREHREQALLGGYQKEAFAEMRDGLSTMYEKTLEHTVALSNALKRVRERQVDKEENTRPVWRPRGLVHLSLDSLYALLWPLRRLWCVLVGHRVNPYTNHIWDSKWECVAQGHRVPGHPWQPMRECLIDEEWECYRCGAGRLMVMEWN